MNRCHVRTASYVALNAVAAAGLAGSVAAGGAVMPSQGSDEVRQLHVAGQLGGNSMDADARGGAAYLTVGPRLQVWDLAVPDQPELVWLGPAMDHMLGQVAAGDGLVFALEAFFEEADEPTACHGLRVFEVAPEHPPRPRGWLPCTSAVNDLAASGRHAALATADGVLMVDAREAGRPVVAGTLPGVRSARAVRVADGLAYVAGEPEDTPGGTALLVFDVTDPSRASLIGRLDLTVRTAAIDVDGTLVFVVSRACSAEVGLEVVDVSDPTNPARLGFRPLTCGILDVVARDGAAHVLGFDYETMIESVFVFDVTDPTSPQPAGVVATERGRSLAAADGHLLVSSAAAGTHVVDVRQPGEPSVATRMPTLGDVADVVLRGETAYATDATGELWIVRVADPHRPRVAGIEATGPGAAALAVHGDYAYVAQPDNTWSGRAGVHVMKVIDGPGDGPDFVEIGAWSDDGQLLASPAPEHMALDGNRLYVPTGRYGSGPVPGFWRLDVSEPAAPEVSEFYPHGADVYSMSASEDRAYLAVGDSGLDTVRMGDDGVLEPIGRVPTGGPAAHAALAGERLSVAAERGGVRLLEVPDSGAPIEVAAIQGVTATSTLLTGDRLLVPGRWSDRDGGAGIRVYDVADPESPTAVAHGPLPAPGPVAEREDVIAVAAGRLGLLLVAERPDERHLFVPSCQR